MAKTMVRRAIAGRVPFQWVTADAVYGFSKGWRHELEQADVFHVRATTRSDTVVTRWSIGHPVHELFPGLPRKKWKRRSCGEGAHGRRIYDWARVRLDDYKVRRYLGWHRHMSLARAAHACPTVPRVRQLDADKAETDPPSSSTTASPRSDA
jgi:SRSO17 transposase